MKKPRVFYINIYPAGFIGGCVAYRTRKEADYHKAGRITVIKVVEVVRK